MSLKRKEQENDVEVLSVENYQDWSQWAKNKIRTAGLAAWVMNAKSKLHTTRIGEGASHKEKL
jgi:hypothetical protein